MPEIDVALEVVLDPMIAATSFVVVRRRSVTDKNGFQQNSAVRVPAIGSVTPVGNNDLDREDGFQSQHRTLLVVTRTALRPEAEDLNGFNWQPDLVYWNGNYYLVKSLEDFGQFGNGMYAATCEIFDYNANAPSSNPPVYGFEDYRTGVYTTILGALPWA
jgi:hypothetical protein